MQPRARSVVPSKLLLSSPPFIGVTVRPPPTQMSDGSTHPTQIPLAAIRRNPPLLSLVISITGNFLIHHNSSAAVPSVINSALHPISISSKLSYKGNPYFDFAFMETIPPEPPWAMISPIVVEDTTQILGATVIYAGIIDYSPDMEKLLPTEILWPEHILDHFRLYIPVTSLIHAALCPFLNNFIVHFCTNTSLSVLVHRQILTPVLRMDDLSNTFTASLNLTALETQIHSFTDTPDHPEDDGREEPSAFLAVKLLTTRHFNSEAFKNRLKQMWPERFSINILEKEPNFYTVEFGCFGVRRRVLIGQPWHFDYKLIVMTPLEVGSVVTAETLSTTPFWIQVSGIPFLNDLVLLHTSSPLPRGTGHFHGMVAPVWLEFRFENLPDFCHYCGRLSHIVNHCHEFLAKCDSSSAPPLLHYDQSLGAKIRITSNPFYIACSRTRLRPHIANPASLASTPPYRFHQAPIITEGPFNEPTSAYGVQHLSQPQTTLMGLHTTNPSPTFNLNHSPPTTTIWQSNQHVATPTNLAPQARSPVPPPNTTTPSTLPPFPTVTVAEQLATSLPRPLTTSAEALVATTGTPQHVVPVSQAFSTILADLHPSQPLRFAVGSSANTAPSSSRVRKFKPQRPDCLNAAEFRRMLKRTRNLAKSLDEESVDEAGDAQRTRLEP
uniref:Zinc knuckle CX2CX4HX4C domain-containing protein n=1 Tax=Cannabis sativa TaxID=3483 RepID=A0A803Q1S8_CANSA